MANKFKWNGSTVTEKNFIYHPQDIFGQERRWMTVTSPKGTKIEVYGSDFQDIAYIVVNDETKYRFVGKNAILAARDFGSSFIR